MDTSVQNLLGLLLLVAAPFAFVFYGKLLAHLRQNGGRVKTDWVGTPDIPMVLVLGGALTGLAIDGLMKASKAPTSMKPEHLLPGMIFLLVLAGGVAVFLALRRVSVVSALGLREVSFPKTVGRGLFLLLAAVPIVTAFSVITVLILGEEAQQQDLVKLFSDVSSKGNSTIILQIVVAGVVVAPICEELIFRGYFYPAAKRFLGPNLGGVLTAALFAISHVNLASLPGLMVLALCFIIAYESTGSLFVPMAMHAFFNGANLLMLYLSAQTPL